LDWRDSWVVVWWSETAMTVRITRLERTASDLRREAGRMTHAAVVRRLLAIALLLEGHSREQAAGQSGPTSALSAKTARHINALDF
jgi:hypothetical protein